MARKKIAVDIDDVLAANAENFVRLSNKRWGTNLKPDDYTEHWAELWKVDFDELGKRTEVMIQEQVFLKHRFFDEAKPVLKKLSRNYTLYVVSSRSNRIQKDTIDWINKEDGGIFSGIHFAPMWDRTDLHTLERLKGTKNDVIKQIGADYLIDDQPKHCIAAAEAGIKTVLFGNYGWNRDVKLRKDMARAKNWQEVLEYFRGQK